MKTYNDIIIPDLIRCDRIVSAFCNPCDQNKIDSYTIEMQINGLCHEFPPIKGFTSLYDENDEEDEDFQLIDLNAERPRIGDLIWKVTDGNHRTISAINAELPHLEIELDYSCITNEKDL